MELRGLHRLQLNLQSGFLLAVLLQLIPTTAASSFYSPSSRYKTHYSKRHSLSRLILVECPIEISLGVDLRFTKGDLSITGPGVCHG